MVSFIEPSPCCGAAEVMPNISKSEAWTWQARQTDALEISHIPFVNSARSQWLPKEVAMQQNIHGCQKLHCLFLSLWMGRLQPAKLTEGLTDPLMVMCH